MSNILKAKLEILLINVIDIRMNNILLKLWLAAHSGINTLPIECRRMMQSNPS